MYSEELRRVEMRMRRFWGFGVQESVSRSIMPSEMTRQWGLLVVLRRFFMAMAMELGPYHWPGSLLPTLQMLWIE